MKAATRLWFWCAAGALAVLPALVRAQGEEEPSLLGAAAWRRPAYDGSTSMVSQLVPIISYEGYPFFARTMQGVLEAGVRKQIAAGLNAGLQLAYESGRRTSESNFLRRENAPTIEATASIGPHLEWNGQLGPVPLSVVARLRQAVDPDHGGQADLRLTVGVLDKHRFQAALFGQGTWADAKSVRLFYGAPGFDPGGGLLSTGLGVFGLYDLSRRWLLMASVEVHRLHGDAAASPLTEKRSNYYLFAGPAYKF